MEWDVLAASGKGTVASYTVPYHPQFPGYEYPLIIVLVDLEEGVRIVANLQDVAPESVRIDMPVEVQFVEVEKDFVIPAFRERQAG